jgi:hypothetical protein
VKAHNNICLVYTKFNALSYVFKLLFFLGCLIALHGLMHFLNTTGPSLTQEVYAYFDRISYEKMKHHYTTITSASDLVSIIVHHCPISGLPWLIWSSTSTVARYNFLSRKKRNSCCSEDVMQKLPRNCFIVCKSS